MIFQLQPFVASCDPVFFSHWSDKKLNVWKLNDSPIPITATFTNAGQKRVEPELRFSEASFTIHESRNFKESIINGIMYPLNKMEDLSSFNKKGALENIAEDLYSKIVESWDWMSNPKSILTFILLTYGDLKKHQYNYISCIPSFVFLKNLRVVGEIKILDTLPFLSKDVPDDWAFVINSDGVINSLDILKELEIKGESFDNIIVVHKCSSTKTTLFGWSLRNLLCAIATTIKSLNKLKVLSYRCGNVPSTIATIEWDEIDSNNIKEDFKKVVGWEKKSDGSLNIHCVNLSRQMDPMSIAEQANSLNVSLIKWRLVPDLNVDIFVNDKVLLLGSGTLGCNVARALVGWGVKHITFVDNSTVSYSNPARQSLYKIQDAIEKKYKCEAAAEALREIIPNSVTEGINLHIPMPGHIISESQSEGCYEDFCKLDKLIQDHDTIFLLLDSKEARWLPTLMCAVYNKLAITVGIGFDSYVILRHGVNFSPYTDNSMITTINDIPCDKLGCYFCNDITSPGNSMSDRTLDMKCTVSRAGNSMNAAGNAVELYASILQHPLRSNAPHINKSDHGNSSLLGSVPHQLRGNLFGFSQSIWFHQRNKNCVGCGDCVIEMYKNCDDINERWLFIKEIINNREKLEQLTGLSLVQENAEKNEEDVISLESNSDQE
uniref:Ubiquitin-like modifier-activating enzyme ATG7 n=1 Tax=Parastrongyloides trichosuri TaxID=131310 RepID=A0A0N4ZMB3_PARTI